MSSTRFLAFLVVGLATSALAQNGDPVADALAQGDLYQSRRKYDLALDAYHKADKLAHHSSAAAYLKLASTERKLGDFSSAVDDAKKAIKAAGENKALNVEALQARASLLAQMAGKPSDKKLKEAEQDLRQALSIDPNNALTHLDLGMVLLRQERDSEGVPELNAYVASPAANPETVAETRLIIANPIRARMPFPPKFSFTTNDRQNISNAALQGKVVLLDFWGTWCPPCRESVPMLRELKKKYSGKPFELVSVSSDSDEDVWKTFVQANHMDWPDYIDLSEGVLHAFKIDSYPTFIVLDKDGVMRFRQSGLSPTTEMDLADTINKALKRDSDPRLAAISAVGTSTEPASVGSHNAAPATTVNTGGPARTDISSGELKTVAAATGEHGGKQTSGEPPNVYVNDTLGLSYRYPAGWVGVNFEKSQAMTQASLGSAASGPQSQPGSSRMVPIPKMIFYASRKGQFEGRLEIPCVRITAIDSGLDDVSVDWFQEAAQQMASASQLRIIGQPQEFQVNQHRFVRADFERSIGVLHVYQSLVQTIAAEHLLSIEIYASTQDELQQIAASVQTMVIKNTDE